MMGWSSAARWIIQFQPPLFLVTTGKSGFYYSTPADSPQDILIAGPLWSHCLRATAAENTAWLEQLWV